jgi:alpha-beta hydrolase superfamily lysophospholipase
MRATPVERQITLRDGVRLAVRIWTGPEQSRGTIVIAHGLGEHTGRYERLAGELVADRWEVHAADHRGHGRSPGARGTVPTLLLYAGADRLVNPEGSRQFAAAAPSDVVRSHCFEPLYHEIFNETGQEEPLRLLKAWLRTLPAYASRA